MPTNMILSPMQPNHVDKEEFNKLAQKVGDGFEASIGMTEKVEKKVDDLKVLMDHRFDEQKSYMDTGFHKLGEQIDAVESNMNTKFGLLSADVSWLKRSMGKVLNNMDKVMDKLGVS